MIFDSPLEHTVSNASSICTTWETTAAQRDKLEHDLKNANRDIEVKAKELAELTAIVQEGFYRGQTTQAMVYPFEGQHAGSSSLEIISAIEKR